MKYHLITIKTIKLYSIIIEIYNIKINHKELKHVLKSLKMN